MKKIYLFVKGAKRWNNLLNKFSKLHKRLQLLLDSDNAKQYNKLVNKLQSVYSKLEKMQYQTGVKVTTTSLAIILSAFTANAQFAAGQLLQAGLTTIEVPQSSKPTFADIDGDGDLDLYLGEQNGKIKVFTNNAGVFTAASDLQAGGTVINIGYRASPTFADIDGDGDLDLYVGGQSGTIKVFTNNSGVFTAASDLQAGATAIDVGSSASPTFADIDGDGDLDLYVGEYYATIKV
ncbi:MAG: VCBS repeat-containing protein [Flavobacteriales bacterium]|nr:VCBS repeat-containing protein [Flavobacteriales bacterium]